MIAHKLPFGLLLLCLLLITACGDTVPADKEMAANHLNRSQAYQQHGQYKAALIEAQNTVKKDPNNQLGYIQLATLYIELGNYKAAIKLLEPLANNVSTVEFQLTLSRAYSKSGKHRSASKLLKSYLDSGGNPEDIDYQLISATSITGQGEINLAIKKIRSIIATHPESSEAKNLLAVFYINQRDYDEAAQIISSSIKSHADNPTAFYLDAQLAYINNDLDRAEKQLTEALIALPESDIIKPLRQQILTQLSRVLTEQGRTTEALIYSKLLASENPESQKANYQLSQALKLLQENKLREAEVILKKLNEDYPESSLSAVYLGMVNYQQGKFNSADNLLSANIDPEISSPKLIETAALAKLRLNKPDEAIHILEQALEIHPDNEHLLTIYGITALNNPKSSDQGAIALEKALAINPEKINARIPLALYYIENDKKERGIAQLELTIKTAPADINAVAYYSQIMMQLGNPNQAKQAVDKLIANNPKNIAAINLAARLALAENNTELAKKHYQKALEINPKNIEAKTSIANIALNTGDITGAIEAYKQAITINPNNQYGYKGLVSAYELSQQPNKGIEALNEYDKQYGQESPTPAYVMAEYYTRNGELDKGLSYFESGYNLHGHSEIGANVGATIYYLKAKQHFNQGDYGNTRKNLLTSSQYLTNNIQVLSLLAETEIQDNQFEEANKIIGEIAANFPRTSTADYYRGLVAIKQNKTADAINFLWAGWSTQPTDRIGNLIYSNLQQTNKTKEASTFLENWQQALPKSQQNQIYRAIELQGLEKYDEAIDLYESIVAPGTTNIVALNNLAWLYFEAGDKRALTTALNAYQVAPENYSVLDTYGWILFKSGDTSKAIELLELASSKAPENTEIKSHLATARTGI